MTELTEVSVSGHDQLLVNTLSSKFWSDPEAFKLPESMQFAGVNTNVLRDFGDLTLIIGDQSKQTLSSAEWQDERKIETIFPVNDTNIEVKESDENQDVLVAEQALRLKAINKDVPPEFFDAMKKELDVIPADIQNYVLDRIGTKVVIAKTYRSVDSFFADQNARTEIGTRQTYGQVPGAYIPHLNTVVVAQFREGEGRSLRGDYNNAELGEVARHEFGHAVDRALVGRTSNDGIKHLPYDREVFSNQTEFVSAFDNDALKVEALLTTSNQIGALVHKDREYLDYFMPKPNGDFKSDFTMKARRELLAEMFAVICEEKYNENGVNISPLRKHHTDLLKNLFPETYLVVLKAVEDMKQGTQKKS